MRHPPNIDALENELETQEADVASEIQALNSEAEKLYPKLAGKWNLHHIIPKYLGGATNGEVVNIPAAYHQLITNLFRQLWPYGGAQPSPQQLEEILNEVYSQLPIK